MLSYAMRAFARRVADDAALRRRIEAIQAADASAAGALLRTIAREAGFNITDRDVEQVFSRLQPPRELADEDLQGIAGGAVAGFGGGAPLASQITAALTSLL